jgi:hypothetical protein
MNGDMDFSVAMRLMLDEGSKIARRLWASDGYRPGHIDSWKADEHDGWIGVLDPATVGLQKAESELMWAWPTSGYSQSPLIYMATRRKVPRDNGIRHGYVRFGWDALLEDMVAKDWYVVTP